MRLSLVALLRCPDDGGDLRVSAGTPPGGAAVKHGELRCATCGRGFPIEDGIVSLLPAAFGRTSAPAEGDLLRQMQARDDEACCYDELYDDDGHRFELDTYLARLAPRPGERVLDIGCGTGRFTKEYAGAVGEVVGADFSVASLRRLLARGPSVQAVRCEAGQLPFATGGFDAIVATSLFSNLPTQATRDRALAEVRRVLAPGGRLLVTVYNHSWWKRARHSLRLSQSGAKHGYHTDGRIPYYNFGAREFEGWVARRFRTGPVFGAQHRLPVLSRRSPRLARELDRLLSRLPMARPLFARELGMVAFKERS